MKYQKKTVKKPRKINYLFLKQGECFTAFELNTLIKRKKEVNETTAKEILQKKP